MDAINVAQAQLCLKRSCILLSKLIWLRTKLCLEVTSNYRASFEANSRRRHGSNFRASVGDIQWRGRDVVYSGGGKQFFRPNAKQYLELINE
jgi:hypothetical protein